MTESATEPVNHPKHYNVGTIEVIDVIEDWKLGFHLGSALKYIARAGHKNQDKNSQYYKGDVGIKEDLEKALWYLNRFTVVQAARRHAVIDPVGSLHFARLLAMDWELDGGLSDAVISLSQGDYQRACGLVKSYVDTHWPKIDPLGPRG